MSRRGKIGLGFAGLLLLLMILGSIAALVYRPQILFSRGGPLPEESWLVAGPFSGNGDNGLYKDYLSGHGEALRQARQGDIAAWQVQGLLRWQAATPDESGWIDFKKIWPPRPGKYGSVAYAYTELVSDKDQSAVATVGSGTDVQIILNGEVVFENRVFDTADVDRYTLVLPLRKGINPVLVKARQFLEWRFQWTFHAAPGNLFVNKHNTIIPDFRLTESVSAWGQVEVANLSSRALPDVTVEVLGDDLVSSAQSEPAFIGPGEVQRIPIRLACKRAVAEGERATVHLRVLAGPDQYSFEAEPLVRKANEFFVTTYRSGVDGSVQPYSVLLPPSFDKTAAYPLIILMHGSQVTSWGRNILFYAPKEWAIQIAVHDRGNNDFREIGEVDIDEAMADLMKRYRIDPDRLYLSGHSMGGEGSWFLAESHPDRWAAISAQSCNSDLSLDRPGTRKAPNTKQQEWERQLLQCRSAINFAENVGHVPAYMMHGALDATVPVIQSRVMSARLDVLGYEHVYDENPENGHWWGRVEHGHGIDCMDKAAISDFFQKHGRAQDPRQVVFKTDSLRRARAYWVTIGEMDSADKKAFIKAEIIAPNNIAVQLDNITQFTLDLNDRLIKTDQPLSVSIDDNVIFHGQVPASSRLAFRRQYDGSYVRLADESVPGTQTPAIKKTGQVYGPVIDAFNKPFLFVVGSQRAGEESASMNEASHRAALALARDWMYRCNGIVRIKADREVTPDDIASLNLILFGNAATNSMISEINDALPIGFIPKGIRVGGRKVVSDDTGMIMVSPNPLNHSKYVLIVGGTTPRSMEIASRLRLTDLPDYVIFDWTTLRGTGVGFVDGGFFDKYWR
jgi:hypothetical protein